MIDVMLKSGKEKSLLRRHPWVYDTAVKRVSGQPASGETVRVVANDGRFLAYATEENGRGVLGTCSADARLTTRLVGDGDIREPAWGPVIY